MKLAPFLTVLFCVAVATQGSTFRSSSDVASAMVRGFMTKLFPIRQTQFASITPLFSTGSSSRGGVRLRGTLGSRVVSTATDPKPAPTMPDLMFVLDSSASIGSTNYTIGKSFMESIVNFIYSQAGATSTSKPRIGVVRFSEAAKTKVDFSLDTHTDAEQVKQAIRGIPYDNGVSTNTAEGLKLAKMELDNKGKPGNAKMIWILTDGNANSGGDPVRLATDIKKAGVEIYASPIGKSVSLSRIQDLVSSPTMDHVYEAPTYAQAKAIAQAAVTQYRHMGIASSLGRPGQTLHRLEPIRISPRFFDRFRERYGIRVGSA